MNRLRSYVFLQGVCSPFFTRLADHLASHGHRVYKINFNAGDWVYWGRRPASNYRGYPENLNAFLADCYRKYDVTDQILFGDRRPVHRKAIAMGNAFGVRTHVFEEGYFRPFWVTLERGGVNGHSMLPRDPQWYRDVGQRLPDFGDGQHFQSSFNIRAIHDMAYHAAGFWNPLFYPHYRTHAPTNAASEYLGYAQRLPLLRFYKKRDDSLVGSLLQDKTQYFFLPLQLGSDAQILDHSSFKDMTGVMEFVMTSFARYAPAEARLVIKNHPLDTGRIDYRKSSRSLAKQLDIVGRVHYIETGDLNALLHHARGTVTVNSTVGALALGLDCPTIALGEPIYDLPGLTFQGDLDNFWNASERPDAALFRCFRNTVIQTTQINGGFYSKEGISLAVENCYAALVAERSPLEEVL
jgi:capsular polysaccharide export protein